MSLHKGYMSLVKRCLGWLKNLSDEGHAAVVVAASAAAVPALPLVSPVALATTHMMAMGTQLGTQVWVAFVAGPTMFVNMERTAFGDLQSRLFPKYGMVGMSTGIIGLASYHLAHPTPDTVTILLAGSTLVHALNTFLVFPITTKYMYERRKHEEGTEEFKKASKKFGITHGISNLVNLGGLAMNLVYFYIIAGKVAGAW